MALDNFHECYHCHPSHPEYCDVHSKDYIQSYGAGSNTGPESLSFKILLNDWNKKVDKLGYFRGEYSENKFSNSIEVLKEHLLVMEDYLKQNLVNLHQS